MCLYVIIYTNHSSDVATSCCSLGLNALDDKPVIVVALARLLRFVGTTDVDKLTFARDKYALNILSTLMLSLQEHSMTCVFVQCKLLVIQYNDHFGHDNTKRAFIQRGGYISG